jgi:hypothetical protein
VLDIGAGTGRASFPLAKLGHEVTMVEPDATMLESLRELAADEPVEVVAGAWPEVAHGVPTHDVAMSAHVVYDVPDIGRFLRAAEEKARIGVVIEMFPEHPWSLLRDLYRTFHQLERPEGPTGADLLAVVQELGRHPQSEKWSRASDVSYESLDEAVAATARRLVLPRSRWLELERYLSSRVIEVAGKLQVPPLEREILTIWWTTADSL